MGAFAGTSTAELVEVAGGLRQKAKVPLALTVSGKITQEALDRYQAELVRQGVPLAGPVTADGNTLYVEYLNPGERAGFANPAIPLVVMIILAVGVVGLGSVLGWRIADIVRDNLGIIVVGAVVVGIAYFWVTSKAKA